jgi:O-antigen ligase
MSNPLVFIDPFDKSLHVALVLTSVFLLGVLYWARVPRVPWEILIFLGYAALSVTWSLNSAATWQAVELYVAVAVVSLLIAANVTIPVLVDGLAWGGVLIVLGSVYALEKQLPGATVPPGTVGLMAGVGTNRNILAYTLVLSLAAVVSLRPQSVVSWAIRGICFTALVLGIYLATSGTGYVAAAAVLGVAGGLFLLESLDPRLRRRGVWLSLGVLVAGGVVAVIKMATLASWLGRDTTLSGRFPLWKGIVEVAEAKGLVVGHGWGAVWGHPWQLAPANDVVNRIYEKGGLVATHGHNSVLDVLPQLGILGVALCLLVYLRPAWKALSLRRQRSNTRALDASRFVLIGLVGHLAFGLTEPLFTIPVGWFVLVMLVAVGTPSSVRLGATGVAGRSV